MPMEVIEPPSEEVLEKVRGEFGLNEQRVRDAVEHLKDWIQLQPHLPKEIGTFGKDTVNNTTLFITVDIKFGVQNRVLEFISFGMLRGVFNYRRFGKPYLTRIPLPLKMGPIGYPKTTIIRFLTLSRLMTIYIYI
jgi:hypothetical protein